MNLGEGGNGAKRSTVLSVQENQLHFRRINCTSLQTLVDVVAATSANDRLGSCHCFAAKEGPSRRLVSATRCQLVKDLQVRMRSPCSLAG
jgi:hypothetical protein